MSFGSRLRKERERLGLTQERFAELGGVKRVSQHLYEQEVRVPDIAYLTRLKERGVDVWFLINGTQQGETSNPIPRSIYVSAFRAVNELSSDRDGQPLSLAEKERLFDFLLSVLENGDSNPEHLRSKLSKALAS